MDMNIGSKPVGSLGLVPKPIDDQDDDLLLFELLSFLCPMSGVLMQNPVIADDGHTYERKYIEQWFETCRQRNQPLISPCTRAAISDQLRENTHAQQALHEQLHERCFRGRLEDVSSVHELRAVFEELDKQRDILSEVLAKWQPPQLVVIGSESSGKSTLLERLVMMPLFPTEENFCTRLPVHVRLRNASTAQAPRLEVFNIRTNRTEDCPYMIPAQTGALDVRKKMQEIISQENGQDQGVSTERIIILHISGPHVPSIDLVDLPGLISSPLDLRDRTRKIVEQHIRAHSEYSIFLATLPATMRPNTAAAIEIVQAHGLEDRTLGVFTKCDDLTSQRRESFKDLVQQDPPSPALGGVALRPHGWYATMNAPINAGECGAGPSGFSRLLQQARREESWFLQHLPELTDSGRGGCRGLVRSINSIFLDHVRSSWGPQTVRKLEEAAERVRGENAALGVPAFDVPSDANTATARSLAAGIAQQMLEEASQDMAQKCCEDVVAGFRERLMSAATAPIAEIPVDDIAGTLEKRKEALLAECRQAAEAWGEFWIAAAAAALRRSDASGFVLARFPVFVAALVLRLEEVVGRGKAAVLVAAGEIVRPFLDESSEYIRTETQVVTATGAATVTLLVDGRELVERVAMAFLRGGGVVVGEVGNLVAEVAGGVGEWVEWCAAARAALRRRAEDIQAAREGIGRVLGLVAVSGIIA